MPTSLPTTLPTKFPTIEPSAVPSNDPTIDPTQIPSNLPSNEPTKLPSGLPSANPTNVPSGVPTTPSNAPTDVPTDIPTIPLTEGECCHARENRNRYEVFCNDITDIYIADCLARDFINRCEWELDNIEGCPVIKGSARNVEDVEVICECVPVVDDGSRASMACQYLDAENCELRGLCKCL